MEGATLKEVSIIYESPHGKQVETRLDPASTKLDLFMRAATKVELDSLRNCHNLEIIDLSKNKLESVNLLPLESLENLRQIRLRTNQLKSIDLWSLVGSKNLEQIDLIDNRLLDVNLTPVVGRASVYLDEGVRVYLDHLLRYLISGSDIACIRQCKHSGEELDTTPRISWKYYSELINEEGWQRVRSRLLYLLEHLPPNRWFKAQKGLLEGFGMAELAGFDGNPTRLLEHTDSLDNYQDTRAAIYDNTIERLQEQLKSGGSTLFLDVQKLAGTRGSKLIPSIASNRDTELSRAIVHIGGKKANLLALWLTHYGFELLKALRFGMITDHTGLELIRINLESLGYKLNTIDENPLEVPIPARISEGLLDYIYSIISIN